MDRIERAKGGEDLGNDPRLNRLKAACDIIKNGKNGRAEEFLHLFSE